MKFTDSAKYEFVDPLSDEQKGKYPKENIAAIITERGIARPPFEEALKSQAEAAVEAMP